MWHRGRVDKSRSVQGGLIKGGHRPINPGEWTASRAESITKSSLSSCVLQEVTGILGPDEHVQRSQRVHFVLFSPGGVLGVMISSTEELNEFLTGETQEHSRREESAKSPSQTKLQVSSQLNGGRGNLLSIPSRCAREGSSFDRKTGLWPFVQLRY